MKKIISFVMVNDILAVKATHKYTDGSEFTKTYAAATGEIFDCDWLKPVKAMKIGDSVLASIKTPQVGVMGL